MNIKIRKTVMSKISRGLKLVLRSSWQTVNIGDIGHTPGMLSLLRRHLPGAELTLWPCDIGNGVKEMLLKNFPELKIVEGAAKDAAVKKALRRADIILHGSGPSLLCLEDVAAAGRPYGALGVTVESVDDRAKELIENAEFVFCRETVSAGFLKGMGIKGPRIAFGPDATFAVTLRNDKAAGKFMSETGLKTGKFVCVIPRLRYTPYHRIHNSPENEETRYRDAVSARFMEQDHAKLRSAVTEILDNSDLQILVCPEMTYEVELGREIIADRLPRKHRSRVVWRDRYWRTDEAASVYAKAHSVISFEMHSPILAVAAGTPAIYLRQPTDTCKGQMWRDIGLADWIFEIDSASGPQIAAVALDIDRNYRDAREKTAVSRDFALEMDRQAVEFMAAGHRRRS
jgi:polysaccharide pyruvyl transferase WcaK-like protein